ncbi:MAG: site-specific integrase, partial [Bacilli bacterium]|nr:site-specific integrase [Bacilli bacterium]
MNDLSPFEGDSLKIEDAIEEYFKSLRVEGGVSNQTIENYREDLKLFLLLSKEKKRILDLTIGDILDFMAYQEERGLAPSTISRRLSTLRGFYNFLPTIDERFKEDPNRIEPPVGFKKLPIVLASEDIEALFEAPDLNKDGGIRDRAMLEIMYASGLRVSELCSLKFKNVDFTTGLLTIYGKGNKQRSV